MESFIIHITIVSFASLYSCDILISPAINLALYTTNLLSIDVEVINQLEDLFMGIF